MIKPIETEYKGYRFRSRLEARWAVFFDACGFKWEYEPEGYEGDGSKYLPDFYIPDFDLHVEVKRNTEDGLNEILEKCESAIQWGGPIKQILILSDVPEGKSVNGGLWHFPVIYWYATEPIWGWFFFSDADNEYVNGSISSSDYIYSRYWCVDKGKGIGAVSDAELRSIHYFYSQNMPKDQEDISKWIDIQEDTNRLVFKALRKARAARFEHGECG